MLKRSILPVLCVPVLVASSLAAFVWAQPTGSGQPPTKPVVTAKETGDDEQEIKFAAVPEAVRSAALKAIGSAGEKSIKKVTKETDEGVTTYEIEFTDNGSNSVTLSAAGDVLEVEHGIAESKLPAPAAAALKKAHPSATLGQVHLVTKTYYEVEMVVAGKKHEVKVNAAGAIEDGEQHEEPAKDPHEKK